MVRPEPRYRVKKTAPPAVSYLEKHELDALLDAPDTSTPQGRRERALLLFLYHTGARASEAAQLRVGGLQLADKSADHSRVTLLGKGGKTRLCPLLRESARALADLVAGDATPERRSSSIVSDARSPAPAFVNWSSVVQRKPPHAPRR